MICTLVFAGVMLQLKWNDIKKETFTKLEYTNRLVQTSMNAVLKNQETVLTVLGKRLLELDAAQNQQQAKKLIDEMLEQNPGLIGFGFTDVKGNYIYISSNLETMQLPNLLEQPASAISFRKTLNNDGMILGRTYFFKPGGKWVIPARLRLTDENGSPAAVMTTAFVYDAEESPWNNSNIPESVTLAIIKQEAGQYYIQYRSGIAKTELANWLDKPIDPANIERLLSKLYSQAKASLKDVMSSQKVYLTEKVIINNNEVLHTFQYNRDYDLFTIVTQNKDSLYSLLTPPIVWLSALLLAFNAAFYLMLYVVSRIQASSKKKLEFQANHDALTQLLNRNYFNNNQHPWKTSHARTACLLFIDLNGFKEINDFYGNRIGDELLKVVAHRLKQVFSKDIVIRLGGDEFIVVIPDITSDEVKKLSGRFLAQLRQTIKIDEIEFTLDARVGICRFPDDGKRLSELLRKADIALTEAKRLNMPVILFSKTLDDKSKREMLIQSEMQKALENNEFSLVYQPQIDAVTRKIIGIETLIRWHNEKLGFVPPDEFISIAESKGMIIEIGRFVLEKSMQEINELCAKFTDQTTKDIFHEKYLRLAVNVSVQQLFHEDFSRCIEELLSQYSVRRVNMMIEITESLFIENIARATEILASFRTKGITISLDDFGTGYSSLSILNQLPIDELKIDKSFVQGIVTNTESRNLIKSIIDIGKNLAIPVLAEGVENIEESDLLSELGCDTFQGYYFSKPLPKEQLFEYLINYQS